MAHKNKASGRLLAAEYVNDVRRLRHMSAEEIQAYYDQVEPVTDNEVQEIFDRVMPGISYETSTIEHEKQSRRTRGKIGRIVLVAVCLTLMLSFVVQALGVPVWKTVVTWAKNTMNIDADYSNTDGDLLNTSEFTPQEIAIWGDDVCSIFREIGIQPALPTYMPDGFSRSDLYYTVDDYGYSFVDALYSDKNSDSINLVADIYTSNNYVYNFSLEYDNQQVKEVTIENVVYHFVSNLSRCAVAWNDKHGAYCISGTVGFDELEKMIYSINRYTKEE